MKVAMYNNIRQAMTVQLMKASNWFVYIKSGTGEGDCEVDVGSLWLPDYGCVDFWRREGDVSPGPVRPGEFPANGGGDDMLNDFMGELGGNADLATVYTNAIECAKAYGDSSASVPENVGDLPTDGSFPECFFNYPVFYGWGEWHGAYKQWWMRPETVNPLSTM
jgi:hypothetical protein